MMDFINFRFNLNKSQIIITAPFCQYNFKSVEFLGGGLKEFEEIKRNDRKKPLSRYSMLKGTFKRNTSRCLQRDRFYVLMQFFPMNSISMGQMVTC